MNLSKMLLQFCWNFTRTEWSLTVSQFQLSPFWKSSFPKNLFGASESSQPWQFIDATIFSTCGNPKETWKLLKFSVFKLKMFQSVFPLPPTFQKQRWNVSEKGADGLYEPFFKISIGENVDSKAWCHSSYLVDEMTFDLLFPGFTKLSSRYSWSRPFFRM